MKWKRIAAIGVVVPLLAFTGAAAMAPAATKTAAPVVTTLAASNVTSTTATLNGSVNPGGLATTTWFQWNPPDGNTNTVKSVAAGTAVVPLSVTITGLQPSTSYTYAAYAWNSKGQKNGVTISFKTPVSTTPTPTPTPTPYSNPDTDPDQDHLPDVR